MTRDSESQKYLQSLTIGWMIFDFIKWLEDEYEITLIGEVDDDRGPRSEKVGDKELNEFVMEYLQVDKNKLEAEREKLQLRIMDRLKSAEHCPPEDDGKVLEFPRGE